MPDISASTIHIFCSDNILHIFGVKKKKKIIQHFLYRISNDLEKHYKSLVKFQIASIFFTYRALHCVESLLNNFNYNDYFGKRKSQFTLFLSVVCGSVSLPALSV